MVSLRQYINDFKKVFVSGIYHSHFQLFLLLHFGVCVIESFLISQLLLIFIMIIAEKKSVDKEEPLCK